MLSWGLCGGVMSRRVNAQSVHSSFIGGVSTHSSFIGTSSTHTSFIGTTSSHLDTQSISSEHHDYGSDTESSEALAAEYLQKHGFTDRTQLLLRHFERVHCLANRYGFRPMLWSDMFFRLAAGGEYYRADCAVDPSVGEKLPGDTALIYWDYYSFDSARYDAMLNAHLQITPNIVFATSARKANSYVPCNHFSIECARHALKLRSLA